MDQGFEGYATILLLEVVRGKKTLIMKLTNANNPRGLVHWKRASSPVEAGTSGFL